MNSLISTEKALSLAYLKAGLPQPENDETLGEMWGLGGDFEVTMHLLEEVIPTAEKLVAETDMDTIHKLYEFYGSTLPVALVRDLPDSKAELEECIRKAIEKAE